MAMTRYFLLNILILVCFCAVSQSKQDGQKLLEQGDKYYQDGNYDEAVLSFSQCITISPELTEAFLGRAMSRELLRDYEGAITDYSIYLEKLPDHYEALLGRANSRFQVGQFEQAKSDYQKLLSIPAGETNFVLFERSASPSGNMQITTAQSNIRPKLFNYLGLTEYKLKNYNQALMWLDSAVKMEPDNADYYVNRGMIKEHSSMDLAMEDYNKALKINPNHSLALHNVAILKSKKGEPEDFFEKAIESDSTMLAPYLERAYQRMESGYFKGALDDYNSAIALEPNDPEIWLNRGFVKEKLNDFKGAYSDYTQAIAIDEKFDKAWLNRGNVLGKQNKYKEAVEDYTVAISINPEYAGAYYNRAIAKEKLKQKSEACADILQAEKLGLAIDIKLKSNVCP
jgi:tetratricopeptide (TPR) repeat protein